MIIEENEMDGACSTCEREEKRSQDFGEEPERQRQLGRNMRKLGDNTKMDLK
jgi:hypothetical protein